MPVTASALLVAALVAESHAQPSTLPVIRVEQAGAPQGEGGRQPAPTDAPHQFGLGGTMGVGSRGGGGSFRYFANDRLGLDMNVGWYRPPVASLGSSLLVAPSFLWMLSNPDPQADIDLRPYVGGGINYSRRFSGSQPTTSSNPLSRRSGVGGQVFGGVEMTFKEAKAIAISAEVAHHEVAATGVSGAYARGTNFYLLFHFYVN
jgi:hypothetical protein